MGSIRGYKKGAEVTIEIAQGFGIELGTEAKRRIRTILLCIGHADNHIDSLPPDKKKTGAAHMLQFLTGSNHDDFGGNAELATSMSGLRDILHSLPAERQKLFVDSIIRIFKCGEILGTTRNTRQFTFVRKVEAASTADLILTPVDEFFHNSRFTRFYRHISIGGNLLDSVVDFVKDKRRGDIAVPPTVIFGLIANQLCLVAPVLKEHPQKRLFLSMVTRVVAQHVGKHFGYT